MTLGDLTGGAVAVRTDQEPAGGQEFGSGGGVGEYSGADELTEGVRGAAKHRVALPRWGVLDLVALSGDCWVSRLLA